MLAVVGFSAHNVMLTLCAGTTMPRPRTSRFWMKLRKRWMRMMMIRVETMKLITSLLNSKTAFRSPAHSMCPLASFICRMLLAKHQHAYCAIQFSRLNRSKSLRRDVKNCTIPQTVQGLLTEWRPHVGCAAACAYESLRRTLFMIFRTTVLMALMALEFCTTTSAGVARYVYKWPGFVRPGESTRDSNNGPYCIMVYTARY